MAKANLENLSDPDDIALAWSKFLVEDLVEQREAKVRPIFASIFVFSKDGEVPCLPTLPQEFSPDNPESAKKILEDDPTAYAYLAVLPGLPVPKTPSGEYSGEPRKQILGIPPEVIDAGEYPWFLMAVFVSPTKRMTFCGAFGGEKFNQVKLIHGSYGGFLSNLLPLDH